MKDLFMLIGFVMASVLLIVCFIGALSWIFDGQIYTTPHPKTPAEVYEECIKDSPKGAYDFISGQYTDGLTNQEISACLQVASTTSQ